MKPTNLRRQSIVNYAKKNLRKLQEEYVCFTTKPVKVTVLNPDSWKVVGTKLPDRDFTKLSRPTIGWVREYECGYGGKILAYVHTDLNDKEIVDAYIDCI